MTGLFWLVLLGFAAIVAWLVWHSRRKLEALRRAEEERFAAFLSEASGRAPPAQQSEAAPAPPLALPPSSPAATDGLGLQKMLFDAAYKAGEAGEPALAIQLYARLLARYPATGFAAQARAAVEAQKKKLSKA